VSNPSDILGLIDDAVHDWEYGPDAARWRADVALAPERRAAPCLQFGPPRVFIGDEEITVTAIEFDAAPAPLLGAEMIRAAAAFEQGLLALSTYSATFTTALADAAGMARQLARAFGLKPCELGLRPCFCHPAPFPAARDYRRRTKHRNRRKR
jgi:hypothetical protein